MVKQRYVGVTFPERDMETLRPFRSHVIKLQSGCRPFGEQYMAFRQLVAAIDECGTYFTKDPTFFHRKPPVGNGC